MSLLKSKKTKALAILTLAVTMLLGSTGSAAPVYAASTGSANSASSTTISYMQTEKPVMNSKTAKPATNIKVMLNGRQVNLSQPILNDNGRTLLPVRAIGDLLGIDIGYDKEYKVAIATTEDITLEIPIGYSFGVRNGEKKAITGTRSTLYNSSTYLPVRYVSENLGVTINYKAGTKTVEITTSGSVITQTPTAQAPTQTVEDQPIPTAPATPATETPAQTVKEKSPEWAILNNKSVADIDESYFQKFDSVETFNKLYPNFMKKDPSGKASKLMFDQAVYTTTTRDITTYDFTYEGWECVCGKSYLPIYGNMLFNQIIRFKDGSYTTDEDFGKLGKTLEDVAYYAYSKGNRIMIVNIGEVDTSSFIR